MWLKAITWYLISKSIHITSKLLSYLFIYLFIYSFIYLLILRKISKEHQNNGKQALFMCSLFSFSKINPIAIYLFKITNVSTRGMCNIYSQLTTKTPKQFQWHPFRVFVFNFEHISHIVVVFPLLTLNK